MRAAKTRRLRDKRHRFFSGQKPKIKYSAGSGLKVWIEPNPLKLPFTDSFELENLTMLSSAITEPAFNKYRPYLDFTTVQPMATSSYLPEVSFANDSLLLAFRSSGGSAKNKALCYALSSFVNTALACPFKVSCTLLQVQHLPISPQNALEDQSEYEESSDKVP